MIRQIVNDWNQFWFSARQPRGLTLPRVAICSVAAAWFGSFIASSSAWFAPDGLLNSFLSGQLLEFDRSPSWQNWSPLWFSDSSTLHLAWLIAGLLLALLGATGLGGRITLLVLWLWIIAWAHRITWLQGAVEPALVGAVAYLIVDPGARLGWSGSGRPAPPRAMWTCGLALRLLQTHWWLLVAAGLLSQLANLIWWRGEGVWWLASAGRSHLFGLETFRGQPSLTNALSHGVILVQMLALWLVLVPAARPLGIALGVVVACVYGLVADQLLYGALLCAVLTSFVDRERTGQPT